MPSLPLVYKTFLKERLNDVTFYVLLITPKWRNLVLESPWIWVFLIVDIFWNFGKDRTIGSLDLDFV